MQPLAQLRNVSVSFGSDEVLSDVSLSVEQGACLGIRGSNGAGKTTLLRVLATLLPPTSGTVKSLPRQNIAMVGHRAALNEFLTLRENLEYVAALRSIPADEVDRVLEATGLSPVGYRRADQASRGMRRRTDLARVSMTQPTLLLLDEPFSGLDAEATSIVDRLIDSTRDRGGAVVVVSHDQAALARVANTVMTVRGGGVG